ncbi:hypothetical protein KDW99_03195 [Marinomonas rhizomae]|uniref:hypothetical protein n=1 Tax=Marinomonas rhizomae TaxID=491948 RepID=UPI002101DBDA|nr:hypothetical protein [Marinomonas rhizomae]UTW00165.1 hypothetical protein KDW99_03195 [Marinomonas rhizomae]
MITNDLVYTLFGIESLVFKVDSLGVATTDSSGDILTFLSDRKFISDLNKNKSIKAVFSKEVDSDVIRDDIVRIYVDDPKWYFFSLMNYLAENKKRKPSSISTSAKIHPTSFIDSEGVVIEDNVLVEPNVTILKDTVLKRGSIVRAGAVLGVDGFEHKKTSKGPLSVVHDGKLIVEENAEIGPNNTIIKGFGYRDTIIGEGSKLDGLVHYAHGVQCGVGCLIAANAMIAGHVTLGNNVWVGPSVSISNRITIADNSFLTIGSVIVRDVAKNEKLTGNFAIPHEKFIRNYAKSIK